MQKRIAFLMCTVSCSFDVCGRADGRRRQKTASQPGGQRAVQVCRRQVDQGGLLQPARQGPQDFRRAGPLRAVWRTGANEATTFVTDANVTIGGKDVPAGSYTMFTVPDQDKWSLIISKKTGEWGIPYPEGEDLGALRYERIEDGRAGGELHDLFPRDGHRVPHVHRLGEHAGDDRDYGEESRAKTFTTGDTEV